MVNRVCREQRGQLGFLFAEYLGIGGDVLFMAIVDLLDLRLLIVGQSQRSDRACISPPRRRESFENPWLIPERCRDA